MKPTPVETLEALVDTHTLSAVLTMLAEIASAKADHIRYSWQDETTAKAYDAACKRLTRASTACVGDGL